MSTGAPACRASACISLWSCTVRRARTRSVPRWGVEIVLCGQTAMHRGLARGDLAAPVQVALLAMTAIATYGARGSTLIAF